MANLFYKKQKHKLIFLQDLRKRHLRKNKVLESINIFTNSFNYNTKINVNMVALHKYNFTMSKEKTSIRLLLIYSSFLLFDYVFFSRSVSSPKSRGQSRPEKSIFKLILSRLSQLQVATIENFVSHMNTRGVFVSDSAQVRLRGMSRKTGVCAQVMPDDIGKRCRERDLRINASHNGTHACTYVIIMPIDLADCEPSVTPGGHESSSRIES